MNEAKSEPVSMEGQQLDGAIVANIDNYEIAEDGRTLIVTVELADHRLAMFQFCPGRPITAGVVAQA